MGQAKQRGTYEQRVSEAAVRNLERERLAGLEREQHRLMVRQMEAILPPVERLRIRNSRMVAAAGLALAASMTLGL